MKAGIFIGLVTLSLGIITFSFATYITLDIRLIKRVVFAGPALIVVGFTMLVFPGGDISINEIRNKRSFWRKAPLLDRTMWLIAIVIGSGLSIYFFN